MTSTANVKPIGIYGPVGASTTIYASKWVCPDCKYTNLDTLPSCKRCKKAAPPKQAPAEGDEALTAQNSLTHKWREVLDPKSQQIYYYNMETMKTSWDRPGETRMYMII